MPPPVPPFPLLTAAALLPLRPCPIRPYAPPPYARREHEEFASLLPAVDEAAWPLMQRYALHNQLEPQLEPQP